MGHQLFAVFAQCFHLTDTHRNQEIVPGRKVPVQRGVSDSRPPSDLVQRGIRAQPGVSRQQQTTTGPSRR